jgi:hypothetical protein
MVLGYEEALEAKLLRLVPDDRMRLKARSGDDRWTDTHVDARVRLRRSGGET